MAIAQIAREIVPAPSHPAEALIMSTLRSHLLMLAAIAVMASTIIVQPILA